MEETDLKCGLRRVAASRCLSRCSDVTDLLIRDHTDKRICTEVTYDLCGLDLSWKNRIWNLIFMDPDGTKTGFGAAV